MRRNHLVTYLAGVIAAKFPADAPAASTLEQIVLAVFDELEASPASMLLIGRDDEEPLFGEYTHSGAADWSDWEVAEQDSTDDDSPIGYWIRRYVAIQEHHRTYVDGRPTDHLTDTAQPEPL